MKSHAASIATSEVQLRGVRAQLHSAENDINHASFAHFGRSRFCEESRCRRSGCSTCASSTRRVRPRPARSCLDGIDRSCYCQAIEVATTSLNSLAGSSLLHSRDGAEPLQQLPREAETLRRSSAPMCALIHASCELGNPGIAVGALSTAYPDPTVMPFEVSLAPWHSRTEGQCTRAGPS